MALGYAPFWHGPQTLSRALSENNLYVASFSSVLNGLVPGMPAGLSVWLGRLLLLPVYGVALLLARRGLPDLIRGCFLATLSFLGLGITNFKTWYATWPSVFAATTPDPATRLAGVIYSFCVTVSVALYGYIWVWLGISRPGTFTLVNTSAYLLDFLPATLALVAGLVWRSSTARIERWLGSSPEVQDAMPPA
jgi:hypothetical protein